MGKRLNWVALQIVAVTNVGDVTTSRKISNLILEKLGEQISPASVASNMKHELNHLFDKELNRANTMVYTRIA